MGLLLGGVLLIVAPMAPEGGRESVAVMRVNAGSLDPRVAHALDALLVARVHALAHYDVVTPDDIGALLGMERLKDALGCDDVQCAAEIGGALGARYLLTANATLLGGELLLSLSLIDARAQRVERRGQARVINDERLFAAALERAVAELFGVGTPTSPGATSSPGAAPVLVRFESTPPGAVVMVDGALSCSPTPCQRAIPSGAHEVQMQLEGHQPVKRSITVVLAMPPVQERLTPIEGRLSVNARVDGNDVEAVVTLDGKQVGVTPFVGNVAVGRHLLGVKNARGNFQREIAVTEGQLTEVAATLAKRGRGSIAAGDRATVRLDEEGKAVAWGEVPLGAVPPGTRLSRVAVGFMGICGVELDGNIRWWTRYSDAPVVTLAGDFQAVACEGSVVCGLRSDGHVVCADSLTQVLKRAPFVTEESDFVDVFRGNETADYGGLDLRVCGLRADGSVVCFKENGGVGPAERHPGPYVAAAGKCGIRPDGNIACRDDNDLNSNRACEFGTCTTPKGKFTAIAGVDFYRCALRQNGTVACWDISDEELTPPPDGTFTDVAVGKEYACGLRPNGAVECWGWDPSGAASGKPDFEKADNPAGLRAAAGVQLHYHGRGCAASGTLLAQALALLALGAHRRARVRRRTLSDRLHSR